MKRTVRDVVTKTVVVADREDPFKEIVGRKEEHRVSAMPVVDGEGSAGGYRLRGRSARGTVEQRSMLAVVERTALRVDGVVGLVNEFGY